jgi:hypothetical protein
MTDLPTEAVGSLVFDSWTNHCPDLRDATSAENRHLIYAAAGVVLDLLIRRMPDAHSLRISGQILYGMDKMESFEDVSNLPVLIESDESRFAIRTNALGEFMFNSIPNRIWKMTITFGERPFVVRNLSAQEPRRFSL